MTKSPWIKIATNPAHIGWYEYRGYLFEDGIRLYWNGKEWGMWYTAGRNQWRLFPPQDTDEWRGQI